MNDPKPLPALAESPAPGYAGRTRYTQLEYEALLANLSLGIAFTRERRVFLCNPKFAEMFGYSPAEMIGMPGETLYPSRESYLALGQIARPVLSAGRQLDLEWEVKRKDGSTFICRVIAKTIDPLNTQSGTVWIVEDITSRRRHADEVARLLREQEAILGNAAVGIVFVKDRRLVRCNRRYEEMYGYEPGEMDGKPASILYPGEAEFEEANSIYDALSRGQTSRRIGLRRRKDGSTFWNRADGRAVDPHDPRKGSVWVVEDITEQRRAEDELQRVLAEQQALLDNVVVGIAFSRERKVVRCNRRFEEMFGYAAGAVIGTSWREIYFTQEEFETRAQLYAELDQGRTHAREQWLRRQDGTGFWCRISGRAVAAGEPARGYVWLMEDITERRRADEALERLVREQDAVLQNAVTGIIFVKDRRVVRSNRRFEEIFGYGAGELINRSTRFMYASDADYESGGGESLYDPVWRGETVFVERRYVRKDGTHIWCSLSGRAVQAGDPSQGSVWLFDDITQEHESEERVQRALAEQELILDNASVGIAFVRNRCIQRCNRFLEDMLGAGPGDLIGQSTATLFASREQWEEEVRRAYGGTAPGETFDGEVSFRRRDGSTFICRARGRRTDTGEEAQEWIWSFEDVTLEREAEGRVQRALAEQEVILDNATVGIAFLRGGVIQRCNRFLEEMAGVQRGALVGKSSMVLFSNQEDWKAAARRAYEQTPPGGIHTEDLPFTRPDGSSFLCHARGRRIDAGDAEQEWIWSCEDVTAEREAEMRVQRALAEQDLILDNATVGIAFVRNRAIQRCNRFLEEMVGAERGSLVGRRAASLFAKEDEWAQAARRAFEETPPGGIHHADARLKRADGSTFLCSMRGRRIDPGDAEQEWIWSYEDVTAEREADLRVQQALNELERAVAERTAELEEAKARAQHLADHDALTGLPNRRLLEDRLTQALALSYRNRKNTAVMFVDLDRFKNINDSLGHSVGDQLLKDVAQRLVRQLRVGDTICRIGGDEFVVVLPEVKRSSDVAHVAQKVIDQLSQPVVVEERELVVTCSIGIAVYPDDGRDAESLIRNADAAMYHAKEFGRANYQFFTEQMNQAASRRLQLENDLRRALAKGELCLHYQPIVDAASGRVAAHEALARWQHPKRGLVHPGEFIQIAEETGIILKIGEWVLREACRWNTFIGGRGGGEHGGARQIAVNLSARQFNDPQLPRMVARALKESGLAPSLLELEITESTAMQQTDVTLRTLKKLKQLGVSIAIDDFGTGYSSLSYLRRFPVDKVKIDRSFVAEVPDNRDQGAIVAAIIALAHALQIRVVAEGVETEAQRGFLKACGCDFVQGYLVGKPADADTAAKEYV
jgi:diguanylate cyclase (GGDEF)-like protein/PAS domain S-box-containing protein